MTIEDESAARPLIEQPGSFNYDYQMRCPNGHSSEVPSYLFQTQRIIEDGVVPCGTCDESIAVMNENIAVRNPDDPALDRTQISNLAWYHTSTHRNWPPPGYAAIIANRLRWAAATMPADVFADMVYREQTKALHLGTYESAIENMHRRMRNQDDADSQFYLHRVSVNLTDGDASAELRHESHEEASQLTLADLGTLRAVRYLNLEESPGSISLAITPSAIATIQTLPLPASFLAAPPTDHIVDAALQVDIVIANIAAQMPDLSDRLEPRIILRARGDADAILAGKLGRQVWDARRQFIHQLVDAYLPGVNPIVQQRFRDAVAWPVGATAESYHEIFRYQAAALSRRDGVIAAITAEARRRAEAPAAPD